MFGDHLPGHEPVEKIPAYEPKKSEPAKKAGADKKSADDLLAAHLLGPSAEKLPAKTEVKAEKAQKEGTRSLPGLELPALPEEVTEGKEAKK